LQTTLLARQKLNHARGLKITNAIIGEVISLYVPVTSTTMAAPAIAEETTPSALMRTPSTIAAADFTLYPGDHL
jgi:hypothetical protein